MKDFKGKNAYVIGGSSGIGLATAKQLSARGANVMIFARNIDLLEEALEEISARRQSDDQRFEARQLDVSIRSEVQMVLTGAVEDFGPPDLLVNSAGRARPHRFEDVTPDMFEATMRVNLFGPRESIFVLLPYMASGAHIVNVSSVAGFLGVFGYTDYCASKFGLLGFSEALRMELRPKGISVSVLCPPDTDTPGLAEEDKTKPEETKALSAGVKLLQPEEVADFLMAGLAKEKFLIIPGVGSRLTHLAYRLLPGLVRWIMDRDVRKVQERS